MLESLKSQHSLNLQLGQCTCPSTILLVISTFSGKSASSFHHSPSQHCPTLGRVLVPLALCAFVALTPTTLLIGSPMDLRTFLHSVGSFLTTETNHPAPQLTGERVILAHIFSLWSADCKTKTTWYKVWGQNAASVVVARKQREVHPSGHTHSDPVPPTVRD